MIDSFQTVPPSRKVRLSPVPANPTAPSLRAFFLEGQHTPSCLFVYDYPRLDKEMGRWQQDDLPGFSPALTVDLLQQRVIWLLPAAQPPRPIQDTLSSQLARYLLCELRRPTVDETYAKNLGIMLSIQLAKCQMSQPAESGTGLTPYQVKQVKEFILARLDQPIRLADMATQVRLSSFYFARRFKQSTGQTPGQFITQLRMQRAKALLLTTDNSVIAVGMDVGYDNPSHFSSAFRRATGVSPTQFRKASLD